VYKIGKLRILMLLIVMTIVTPAFGATSETEALVIANKVLIDMESGAFESANLAFSSEMKAALTPEILQTVQGQFSSEGSIVKMDTPHVSKQSDMWVVVIRVHRAKSVFDAKVAIDPKGQVAGLHFVPAPPPAVALPSLNSRIEERDFWIGSVGKGLPGTLTLPAGTGAKGKMVPGLLLVHGSGPQDRDETIGPNRPFLDIARSLAEQGVAVLRYDKRTKVHPEEFLDGKYTVDDETTNDAVAAIEALKNTAGIDPTRIYVFGHSLGGMLASRIAIRSGSVAGVILFATPARPLLDILPEQLKHLFMEDGVITESERMELSKLSSEIDALTGHKTSEALGTPLGLPASYWDSLSEIDAIAETRGLECRILVLQGGRDFQVGNADWRLWRDGMVGKPNVTLKFFESLNHLGIAGDGPAVSSDYERPGHVDKGMLDDIAAWILLN
jgi:uncharacterized protein